MRRLVESAIARGHLRADLDARQFTWELFGIYLMHHYSSRLLRAPDADARALAAFDALVRAGQPS